MTGDTVQSISPLMEALPVRGARLAKSIRVMTDDPKAEQLHVNQTKGDLMLHKSVWCLVVIAVAGYQTPTMAAVEGTENCQIAISYAPLLTAPDKDGYCNYIPDGRLDRYTAVFSYDRTGADI